MQLRRSCFCLAPKSTRLIHSEPRQTAMIWTSKGLQIRLHVKPNSKADRILDVRKDSVHVAVSGMASKGDANGGVINLMSRVLGVRKSKATLVAGRKSREKVMLVNLAGKASNDQNRCEDLAHIIGKLRQAIAR